jgi:hypothetical protein
LAIFSNQLYAATYNDVTGVEVWCSSSGAGGSWTQVNEDSFGEPGLAFVQTMDVFNNRLYVGVGREGVAELWRTADGEHWTAVFTDGLAENNTNVSAMAVFNGEFYIGLRNIETGGEVWKSSNGLDWTSVVSGGLGNVDNGRPYGLIDYAGELYLVFSNLAAGGEVWRSSDGVSWEPIMQGGWGDSNNDYIDYVDKAAVVFKNRLYIGTLNDNNGGEVWMLDNLPRLFLPVLKK